MRARRSAGSSIARSAAGPSTAMSWSGAQPNGASHWLPVTLRAREDAARRLEAAPGSSRTRAGLLRRGQARPERVERGGELVVRGASRSRSCSRGRGPPSRPTGSGRRPAGAPRARSVPRAAASASPERRCAISRGVLLHPVEQRVQADRHVVDDVHAERAEAVRGVEARLAHRAVALVEERRRAGPALRVVEAARRRSRSTSCVLVVLARAVVVRAPLGVLLVAQHLRAPGPSPKSQ